MMRSLRVLSSGFVVAMVLATSGIARADDPAYPAAVIALGADHYYRLDEMTVGVVADSGTSPIPIPGTHAGDGGEVGVEGVTLPGFPSGNRAFFANDAGAVNLGDGAWFGQATMTVALWYKDPKPTGTGIASDRLFQNNAGAAPLTIATSGTSIFPFGGIHVATGPAQADGVEMDFSKLWLLNNAWHHLVVVRNGNRAADLAVYVDGVNRSNLFSQDPWSWTASGDYAWIAAGDLSQGLGLSNATVDEVAIWNNRALSVAEVQGLYDAAVGAAPVYSGYAGAVLAARPIAYYRLEEDAGLAAGDAVRNWVHGDSQTTTLGVGTAGHSQDYSDSVPTFGEPSAKPSDEIAGMKLGGLDADNRAAEFFGNSIDDADMVHIGGNPAWDTEEKSYTLLFKTGANDTRMRLVASDPGSDDDFDLVMDQGRLVLVCQRAPGVAAETDETYKDGQWHHVVAVRAGDSIEDLMLVVDGEQVNLTMVTVPRWDAPSSGRIGALTTTDRGFCGLLDEIAIWDRALSYSESLALFDSLVAALPGDANGDGSVDDADASILASHWLQRGGANWEDGDFNRDGDVNDADAAILAAHWSGSAAPDATPEPSVGVLLMAMAAVILGAWIRRRADRTPLPATPAVSGSRFPWSLVHPPYSS